MDKKNKKELSRDDLQEILSCACIVVFGFEERQFTVLDTIARLKQVLEKYGIYNEEFRNHMIDDLKQSKAWKRRPVLGLELAMRGDQVTIGLEDYIAAGVPTAVMDLSGAMDFREHLYKIIKHIQDDIYNKAPLLKPKLSRLH